MELLNRFSHIIVLTLLGGKAARASFDMSWRKHSPESASNADGEISDCAGMTWTTRAACNGVRVWDNSLESFWGVEL